MGYKTLKRPRKKLFKELVKVSLRHPSRVIRDHRTSKLIRGWGETIQDRHVSDSLSYKWAEGLKELEEGWNREKTRKGKADGDDVRIGSTRENTSSHLASPLTSTLIMQVTNYYYYRENHYRPQGCIKKPNAKPGHGAAHL